MRSLIALMMCLIGAPALAGNGYCGSCYQYGNGGYYYTPQKSVVVYPQQVQQHYHTKEIIKEVKPEYRNQNNTSHSLTITNYFQYSQPAAEQGVTQYGLGDPYGQHLDLGALLTLHGRNIGQGIEGLSGLAGKFGGLLEADIAGRSRVAEILAKGQAAAQVARAVSAGESGTRNLTLQGQFGDTNAAPANQGSVQGSVGALDMGRLHQAIEQVVLTRCAECHNDKEAKGGVNMLKCLSFDVATMDKVMDSIEGGKMPKDAAEPLSTKEKSVFGALYQVIQQRAR